MTIIKYNREDCGNEGPMSDSLKPLSGYKKVDYMRIS